MTRVLPNDPEQLLNILPHYLIVSPDYYEPIDQYTPNSKFKSIVESELPSHWRTVRSGVWHQVLPPRMSHPVQGWKIHVSATISDAEEILKRVSQVCAPLDVSFKFLLDDFLLVLANSKNWSRGASGKFVTIYPVSEEQFKEVIELLYEQLIGFEGAYILSDRRYKDCKVLYISLWWVYSDPV